MFTQVPADQLLTQGDILDDCAIYRDQGTAGVRKLARVVVLTQACDIAQTKSEWIVVATVSPATELVDSGTIKATALRDQVRLGKVFGWYFLPAAVPPISFPESVVNLRDLHTVPKAALEKLAAEGKRVARLTTPYREHLAQHFAVSYMRIALPEPYETRA